MLEEKKDNNIEQKKDEGKEQEKIKLVWVAVGILAVIIMWLVSSWVF